MNKVSGRILSAEPKHYEWPKDSGKMINKWEVSIQVGNETKKYHCYNKAIEGMSGKDVVDYIAEPAKKEGYPDTIKIPSDKPAFGGFGKGKASYVDNGPTTAWDTILMVAKDLYIAGKITDSKQFVTFQQRQFKMYQDMVVGKHEEPKPEEKKEAVPVTENEIPF